MTFSILVSTAECVSVHVKRWTEPVSARRITVTGVVQGVGYRPFIYGLASSLDLRGWVRNTTAGVEILVEGRDASLGQFVDSLTSKAPPLAHVEGVLAREEPSHAFSHFEILESVVVEGAFQAVSPDVSICPDCERELLNPADRRYLYPFINCTNCGPRFTIIKDLPYDRPNTTMSAFPMCPDCASEYEDPSNRRFHAQPTACPVCGPYVQLRVSARPSTAVSTIDLRLSAVLKARHMLQEGKIVAVKGLGGYHVACDATNDEAVRELRRRKGRAGKPFAVMMPDLATAERYCEVGQQERELLLGHERPVVLLRCRPGTDASSEIAPGMDTLGVMLPYTPLHHLLLNRVDPRLMQEDVPRMLVMTSGNLSEEPIAVQDEDALARLAVVVDAFLMHNREIYVRCDDSVVRIDARSDARTVGVVHLRRSRGYAPYPVRLPYEVPHALGVGGELKNAFCLAREEQAFLSQHIGDMENAEVLESFERNVEHLGRLFRVEPRLVAHDLHPDYMTTTFAKKMNLAVRIGVQHHHAHIASCMADNGLSDRSVIGLAFDGTGYGLDGRIWGGEFLLASYSAFDRASHLEYLPLPGGDAAIRSPWRMAVGYAESLGIDLEGLPFLATLERRGVDIVRVQVRNNVNAVESSSLGRLFDAVAALAGVRNEVSYEAQAAMELEVLSRPHMRTEEPYPGELRDGLVLLRRLLESVVEDVRNGVPAGLIGARFHRWVIRMARDVCLQVRDRTGLSEVVLSGGVWQNQILLDGVHEELETSGFGVYTHRQVPANDGGIALGQVAVAAAQMSR